MEFAQKGGGVIATGGAFGFAPEYADTPLSRMLPVEIESQGQVEDPRVAMAIMLDRSGSMGARVGRHTKIQLAVEAALAAAFTLRPDDILALGSVDTKTTWNHPLGPLTGLAARRESIRSLDAGGGGIYVYTALVDAYAALGKAVAPVRHVILFADTADAEEQAENCSYGACPNAAHTAGDIAETARRSGITTSVVGIGREGDSDTQFLRKLAGSGGGRFYITGNAADLRRIFVSEARVATRSNLREGPVSLTVAEDHPDLAGVYVSAFPPLGGFVEAKRRGTADTALVTRADDRPILASWRYGLGKVVTLTTDLRADWKSGWSTFKGAGQVLRQAVRFAVRRHGAAADVRIAVGDHGAVHRGRRRRGAAPATRRRRRWRRSRSTGRARPSRCPRRWSGWRRGGSRRAWPREGSRSCWPACATPRARSSARPWDSTTPPTSLPRSAPTSGRCAISRPEAAASTIPTPRAPSVSAGRAGGSRSRSGPGRSSRRRRWSSSTSGSAAWGKRRAIPAGAAFAARPRATPSSAIHAEAA